MKEESKMSKCRWYFPTFTKNLHQCIYGAKTIGDADKFARDIKEGECENCSNYKCKYIEYPIMVNKIEYGDITPWDVKPSLVKIKVCGEDKTFLGIYLGKFPHFPSTSYDEENKTLEFNVACNPCIYVPDLQRVVWGCESWWERIESEEELKEITDEDIDNVWYVKMLKSISRGKEM